MRFSLFASRGISVCLLVALSLAGCDESDPSAASAMSAPSALPLAGSPAPAVAAATTRPAAASGAPALPPTAAMPGLPTAAMSAPPPAAAMPQMPSVQPLQPVTALTRNVMRDGANWALPVVLFNDGMAALHVDGPAIAAPLTDRVQDPDDWAKWRKEGDSYEYLSSSGSWKALARRELPPLPKGHKLDLPYYTISATSNVDTTLVRSAVFEFFADSTFTVSKSVNAWNEHTPVAALASDARGTYEIDGYLLTLTFANGQREQHGLVSYGEDEWMIWINGAVYCHLLDGRQACSSK